MKNKPRRSGLRMLGAGMSRPACCTTQVHRRPSSCCNPGIIYHGIIYHGIILYLYHIVLYFSRIDDI